MAGANAYDLEGYEMGIDDVDRLLEPGYLPFEDGYRRLSNGRLHVAVRTRMPGCTGEMVDWWFRWVTTTERYKLWHPRDHVSGEWEGRDGDEYVGATHVVEEYIGGELTKLELTFVEPSECFDPDRLDASGATAICARGSPGGIEHDLFTVVHCVRDTDFGCEMRSHFWLEHLADYDIARGVHQHCVEEMNTLAAILPTLYATRQVDE